MRTIIAIIVILAASALWWLFLDARAPASADNEFDIAAYRALIDADGGVAEELRIAVIGGDQVPAYAVEAGGGFGKVALAYQALQVVSEDSDIIIGGAVDNLTADEMAQSDASFFDARAYRSLLDAMKQADAIYITHEHLDHVMAITRHPTPEAIVDKLRLTAPQLSALAQFPPPGEKLNPAFASVEPIEIDGPVLIAPGIVAAPAPGHSPGSLVFFIRRADGREYFLIGDIVWNMSNITHLKTRPRILQYLFFKGSEDRNAILRQVRAIHDIQEQNPDLAIIPVHDAAQISALIDDGALITGLAVGEDH